VAYRNCAGFLQVRNGSHFLDSTLVHPDDYAIASLIIQSASSTITDNHKHASDAQTMTDPLKQLQHIAAVEADWEPTQTSLLSLGINTTTTTNHHRNKYTQWVESITNAVSSRQKHKTLKTAKTSTAKTSPLDSPLDIQSEQSNQISSILTLLLGSGIDPRRTLKKTDSSNNHGDTGLLFGSSDGDVCELPELIPLETRKSLETLQLACPIKGVRGEVGNVTDFGAFINLGQGACRDGLLHKSQFPRNGSKIIPGQIIEIDVQSVDVCRGRIEIKLAQKKRKMLDCT